MVEQSNSNPLDKLVPVAEQRWEEDVQPLVSISCLTYNHAPFIRDALEGFLMQETTFPVEILIHDDASTDGTVEIIREYKDRFSKLIFPIYQSENQFSQGVRGMMARFNFPRARGKYIALCEGDDYWTDPLKLQKQVDFLETNPGYSGASHQAHMMFVDEPDRSPSLFQEHNITDIETHHLLDGRLFHTASLIFRSEIIKNNSLPSNITAGDRALFFLLTAFGKIRYSNDVMCYYRKHSGGMSSWITTEMLEKDLKIVPWISKINPSFPSHQYSRFLHLVALRYPKTLSVSKVIKHSIFYIYHSLFSGPNKFQDIKTFVKHHFPSFLAKTNQTGRASK